MSNSNLQKMIERLIFGKKVTDDEIESGIAFIRSGEASDALAGGFLAAVHNSPSRMNMKIVGCDRIMREIGLDRAIGKLG